MDPSENMTSKSPYIYNNVAPFSNSSNAPIADSVLSKYNPELCRMLQTSPINIGNGKNTNIYHTEHPTGNSSLTSIYSSPSAHISNITEYSIIPTTPPIFGSYNNMSLRTTPSNLNSLMYQSSNSGTPNTGDGHKMARGDKNNKGLRHFSMKVLQKVQYKGVTTYNEVADELVKEFGSKVNENDQQSYDHKNIRRRVYDALNVLMAMNIIHKEKKEIKWVGLPTNSLQESQHLESKRNELLINLTSKIKSMKELIIQQVCLKNLIQENQAKINMEIESEARINSMYKMELPFAILCTNNNSTVDCSVTANRDDYFFSFDSPFEVFDDFEILRRLGYSNGLDKGPCSVYNIDASKRLVPRSLHPYIDAIGCCTTEEFEDFILSHRIYLDHLDSSNKFQTAKFINKLIEGCNKKWENIPFHPPSTAVATTAATSLIVNGVNRNGEDSSLRFTANKNENINKNVI